LAGPTLAGALIGVLGAPLALIADALSFLSSALLLRGVPVDRAKAAASGRRSFRRELADGLRAVRERPALMLITCGTAVSNFGLAASQAVLLLFLYRGLHLHPFAAGIALGLGAAGNVAGAALAPTLTRKLGTG